MSRWAADPERAADELILRSLEAIDPRGRVLAVNQSGALPLTLADRGLVAEVWNRRFVTDRRDWGAAPWPPSGPFDLVLLRLPKAKDEQEMAAHACLSVLAPDGRLVVYGGNDEGIRSAAAMLGTLCGAAETLVTRGHGRVVAVIRPADATRVLGTLAQWQRVAPLDIAGTRREWISYPGVFADRRIDEGTALLIAALPAFRPAAQVLDFACGSGVIVASALAREPTLHFDMLDNDAVALTAAGQNVPGARPVLGMRLGDVGSSAYDAILSNPPLHAGISESHEVLEYLIADAPAQLTPGGVLQIVVQRRVPLDRLLAGRFQSATVAAETGRFRVWRAHAPELRLPASAHGEQPHHPQHRP
jgi:16S rRNA G1207 methylase RsmC